MVLFLFLGDISDIGYVGVQFCWLAESTTVCDLGGTILAHVNRRSGYWDWQRR